MSTSDTKELNQTMKRSTLTKVISHKGDILQKESYDHLMNLRTTLLHMQYLHASLSQRLERQHINQENQHKDHLIQCFNLKQELQQLRKNNFTKLFIVKLQQLLAIEETCNQYLIVQPENSLKIDQLSDQKDPEVQQIDFDVLPKIQKLNTFAKIHDEEMQSSLCKLYIGNKAMLDLQKTSHNIEKIQQKIDNFLVKHSQTLNLYNQKLKELEQVQATYKNYFGIVKPKIAELNQNDQINLNQQNQNKIQSRPSSQKSSLYQAHIKNRLIQQKKAIQIRLSTAKNKILFSRSPEGREFRQSQLSFS